MGIGDVVQAIFKKKPDEYKEAVVRFL